MKTLPHVIVIGLGLYCAVASGQEPSPGLVSVPLAGATISDFRGTVTIQIPGRPFTSPARGEVLPPETTINTGDGRLLLRLADGSDIVVRRHTRLLLKQEEIGGWGYLKLLIGRINAQIQKHLGGSPPLHIGTPSAVISVRGTRFEVEVDRHGFTQVDVEEGVVVLNSANGEGEGVLVTAGFSSRVGFESPPEEPRPTPDLRPQLERPDRKGRDPRDDDPMAKLAAADPARRRERVHKAELYDEGGNRPAVTPTSGRE